MGNSAQQCAPSEDVNSFYNPPIIIITFILGFAGNAIALWTFCFHVKSRRPNIVYSVNLMIADVMLTCCLPFRAAYFLRGKDWIFGDVLCRLNTFMISLNRAGSIFFLMVIAIDRYFKVVHPLHKVNKISTRCAVKIAGGVWVVAVAICLHLLIEKHNFKQDDVMYCEPFNINNSLTPTAIWTDTIFIFFKFLLPVSVILFSTSCVIWKLRQLETGLRSKYKRAVKLVIAVAAVFVICFLPTNIAVVAVLVTKLRSPFDCKSYNTAVNIFYNTLFVTYLNSVVDPLIYYFSNSAFNDALKKALCCDNLSSCRSAKNQEVEQGESKVNQTLEQQMSSVTPL
ncbi:hydroxycarboxylic acid receptor 2-like [Pristis pectinata]|uniref:hydroxycarboxylic acid receptor 2-like n=1 Tax=Pristis pectinata TaxID=685728 RepID=UPI00223DF957|nr:hydroxycarboxylic acid receptor 2-like [Pristis pectinata]